jgi:hypothetical protein
MRIMMRGKPGERRRILASVKIIEAGNSAIVQATVPAELEDTQAVDVSQGDSLRWELVEPKSGDPYLEAHFIDGGDGDAAGD